MSHKHCIFCGEEVPCPRPTNWSLVCIAESNTGPMDTMGKRYHAVLLGRESNYKFSPIIVDTGAKRQTANEALRKVGICIAPGLGIEPAYAANAIGKDDFVLAENHEQIMEQIKANVPATSTAEAEKKP